MALENDLILITDDEKLKESRSKNGRDTTLKFSE
jgi:hypothetical protein